MNRIIQQITDHFADQLPDNQSYFKPKDFHDLQFPSFLIQRILLVMEHNLQSSLGRPATDWADIDSDAVQESWNQFVSAICAEVHLPASCSREVIEAAVFDCLAILVQPRESIPEVLFGPEKELSVEEVERKTKALVVYRHFSRLLSRYMHKKSLNSLSKIRCRTIITAADQKMTANYTPEHWVQMLEPLFNLQKGNMDPSLLCLFFEDKKRDSLARRFASVSRLLSKKEVIDILSTPDGSPEKMKQVDREQSPSIEIPHKAEVQSVEESLTKEDPITTTAPGEEAVDLSLNGNFQKGEEEEGAYKVEEDEEQNEEEPFEEVYSLNALFEQKDESRSAESTKVISGYEAWEEQQASLTDKQVPVEQQKNSEPEEPDEMSSAAEPGEEIPMWKRFFTQEAVVEQGQEEEERKPLMELEKPHETGEPESPTQPKQQKTHKKPSSNQQKPIPKEPSLDDSEPAVSRVEPAKRKPRKRNPFASKGELEKSDTNGEKDRKQKAHKARFLNTPIFGSTGLSKGGIEEISQLRNILADSRSRFINHLFKGSEQDYEQAIKKIASCTNWREASRFVGKNIFKQNRVNIYSEQAVEFTDRLQEYFNEKQNR